MKHISEKAAVVLLCALLAGCSADKQNETEESVQEIKEQETVTEKTSDEVIQEEDIEIKEALENSEDGGHAIEEDGSEASYSNILVVKSGESSGDEADFYGENAAVYALNGASLELSNIVVRTDGTHANAVFSYGEGTTVTISDSVIETSGNCSGGLMTTGGGTMNAEDLNIHTTGNSSAAIRSDRGGGTVNVSGGSYITDGKGSPVVYSTADITVSDAYMESTSSQGIVVEGKNSVTLNDVELVADNNSKNSDKSDTYQAVMIYQSMSGDAAEGLASFTMNGGTLTNKNGDIFFVNNTTATIDLTSATIVNEDEDGAFLRAEAAGWGSEGSNGGQVTLTASEQEINGDMSVDGVSSLNLYLKDGSVFTGEIDADGEVYVEIEEGSKWVLTDDSEITSLTCAAGCIDLNGHTLTVNGVAYEEGSASQGEAIEVEVSSSGHGEGMPEGAPPEMPGGERPSGNPPEMPNGEKPSGTPPEKPSGEKPSKKSSEESAS